MKVVAAVPAVAALTFISSITGAEIARWSADQRANSAGITLVKGPDADWSMETVAGIRVAAVTPVKDYYRRASILLRVDKPAQQQRVATNRISRSGARPDQHFPWSERIEIRCSSRPVGHRAPE